MISKDLRHFAERGISSQAFREQFFQGVKTSN